MAIFDEDAAWKRCARMWRQVGGLLEAAALNEAERGFEDRALKVARAAAAAYWQAAGSCDEATVKDLMARPTQEGA